MRFFVLLLASSIGFIFGIKDKLLRREPLRPEIREVLINPINKKQIDSYIHEFELRSRVHLIGSMGNFPITIEVIPFEKEDKDKMGYALIDNISCEIKLNSSEEWTATSLRLVLFHELGHCLGLDHDDPPAVMSPDYELESDQIKDLSLFFKLANQRVSSAKVIRPDTGVPTVDHVVKTIVNVLNPAQEDSVSITRPDSLRPILRIKNQ